MLHASSQVPHAFRRASDKEALLNRFNRSGSANRRDVRPDGPDAPDALSTAEPGLNKSERPDKRQGRGESERQAKADIADVSGNENSSRETLSDKEGVSNSNLINSQEANNLWIETQVNHFNQPDANRHSVLSAEQGLDTGSTLHQLQIRLQQQQQLRQVEHLIHSSLNLSTLHRVAVVELAKLFGAKQTILMKYQAQQQRWQQVAQYCQNQSVAWQRPCELCQEEFPDLTRQVFQNETLNIFTDQPLPTTETRQWLACQPGSWLILPISLVSAEGKSHWGVIAMALPEAQRWAKKSISLAQDLIVELSCAIAQAEQYQALLVSNQALQKLALSDGLTELANRRRFDEYLADEWQRLARDRQPLSLILCDLDHFKHYNDTFGHPAGDRCLTKVAAALKSGPRRPADLVARYGGEEFAIVLPNTDTNGAWRIAQKLHHSIRSLRIAHTISEETPYVTVTMGVSTVIPGHDTTAQVLVQAADLALYHAKKQGRDRTYVHAHYNTVTADKLAAKPGESQLEMTPPEEP